MSEDRSRSPSPARVRVTRVVGWIYLAIGAFFVAAMLAPWLLPPSRVDDDRGGEWLPLVWPFLLLFPVTFTCAGYRVLRHPPLHRRRILLSGFVGLACAWFAWSAFLHAS